MRRFIVGFFALIGLLVVLLVAGIAAILHFARPEMVRIAGHTVLDVNLTRPFPDSPPPSDLMQLLVGERSTLRDVLDSIGRATDDPHIVGLVAHIGDGEFAMAQVQELRDAITAFRIKGKRAVAYADSFGELASGTKSYYLATAFDEIWLQPLGIVGLVGLRAEVPFFRGSLDKLGVVAHFDHREQYKTAMNTLTDTSMTEAHREETQALLDSAFAQIVRGIAADRRIESGSVRALIDRGPLLADEALQAKLIDHIGYRDEAAASLMAAVGGKDQPLSLRHYLERAGRPHQDGPTIALIYATGLIMEGDSSDGRLTDMQSLGADTLIQAFRKAERDPKVKAILFRIDSPGGSAVASESILRETQRARQMGKPVIVSMGDVAGSGGYYIAAAADKIVAEPGTLTGSIGVVAGKLVVNGLLQKLGVTWDAAQIGQNADIESSLVDFSPDSYRRFEAFLDAVYAGFKQRVADGRKLAPNAVEEVAKGRVWTGEDAKARGLVDAMGGYETAIAVAKAMAGVPVEQDVKIQLFPPPSDPATQLIGRMLGRDLDPDDQMGAIAPRTITTLGRILLEIEMMTSQQGNLVMAPVELH